MFFLECFVNQFSFACLEMHSPSIWMHFLFIFYLDVSCVRVFLTAFIFSLYSTFEPISVSWFYGNHFNSVFVRPCSFILEFCQFVAVRGYYSFIWTLIWATCLKQGLPLVGLFSLLFLNMCVPVFQPGVSLGFNPGLNNKYIILMSVLSLILQVTCSSPCQDVGLLVPDLVVVRY